MSESTLLQNPELLALAFQCSDAFFHAREGLEGDPRLAPLEDLVGDLILLGALASNVIDILHAHTLCGADCGLLVKRITQVT